MLDLYCRKKFAFINYHRKKFLKEKRHFPFRPEVEIKIFKVSSFKKNTGLFTRMKICIQAEMKNFPKICLKNCSILTMMNYLTADVSINFSGKKVSFSDLKLKFLTFAKQVKWREILAEKHS